jgi:hypothetical protein
MVQEIPGAATPLMPEASVSPVDAPADHTKSPGHLNAGLTPVVVAAEQHPKPPLMADIIKFPEHIYLKAKELPPDQRLKLAGQLAAEVLKRYPHLIQQLGSTNDPVPAWTILRNFAASVSRRSIVHPMPRHAPAMRLNHHGRSVPSGPPLH